MKKSRKNGVRRSGPTKGPNRRLLRPTLARQGLPRGVLRLLEADPLGPLHTHLKKRLERAIPLRKRSIQRLPRRPNIDNGRRHPVFSLINTGSGDRLHNLRTKALNQLTQAINVKIRLPLRHTVVARPSRQGLRICLHRHTRREVLFAKRLMGISAGRRKKFTVNSKVRC